MVKAFKATNAYKAFFPGPGGADPTIYSGQNASAAPEGKGSSVKPGLFSSATKRGITGKGWNRNTWYAIKILGEFSQERPAGFRLNLVGHSRGSINVIMLLNDLFFQSATPLDKKFTVASTIRGTKSIDGDQVGSPEWIKFYEKRLRTIWAARMGTDEAAAEGIEHLASIRDQDHLKAINVFLFDPVAGVNQGNTSRKQDFPDNVKINQARVLRMEQGGAGGGLSTNMPLFPGWEFLNGTHSRDLLAGVGGRERVVIPLPGSHGAGISANENAATIANRYIGTSYMLSMLSQNGTRFAEFGDWAQPSILLSCYNKLMAAYQNILPGSGELGHSRRDIHTHHTADGYDGGFINAHHRFLSVSDVLPSAAPLQL